MAFNPNEPRDNTGKWTDAGMSSAIKDKLAPGLAEENLTEEEKKLLNKDYATEQQFTEAYQNTKTKPVDGTEGGRQSGGEGEISESEKEKLKAAVSGYMSEYKNQFGIPDSFETDVKIDPDRAKRIADYYDKMPDAPNDPAVKKAYAQLATEVDAQYNYVIKKVGLKVAFSENDPYADSKEMRFDVVKNNTLRVYSGGDDHPLLGSITKDSNGLTANEKFRAVHDYFGHAVEGNQFGKLGEERAWVAHSKMFSPLAQSALTTETRGQNSWVNFSGANTESLKNMSEGNKLILKGFKEEGKKQVALGQSQFKFAEQKVNLLPQEFADYTVHKKNVQSK